MFNIFGDLDAHLNTAISVLIQWLHELEARALGMGTPRHLGHGIPLVVKTVIQSNEALSFSDIVDMRLNKLFDFVVGKWDKRAKEAAQLTDIVL